MQMKVYPLSNAAMLLLPSSLSGTQRTFLSGARLLQHVTECVCLSVRRSVYLYIQEPILND